MELMCPFDLVLDKLRLTPLQVEEMHACCPPAQLNSRSSVIYLWSTPLTPPSNNLQEEGLQAVNDLENSFKEFDRVLETGDKQAVPIRQQNALGYVGQIEEAMVKEFPYQVPSEYDYLPQLKVRVIAVHF